MTRCCIASGEQREYRLYPSGVSRGPGFPQTERMLGLQEKMGIKFEP